MLPQLSRPFRAMEANKQALLDRLGRYETTELSFRPSASEWSALEILDHLILSESGILDAMIRSIPHGHAVPARDRITGRLLELLFYTPARVRAPAQAAHILPKGEQPLEAHSAAWSFIRRRMAETLEGVPVEAVRRTGFQHPVSGRMDVPQTLRFLNSHMVHHGYQLRRYARRDRS